MLTLSALNIYGMFTLSDKRTKSSHSKPGYSKNRWERILFPKSSCYRVFIRWSPFLFIHLAVSFTRTRRLLVIYYIHTHTHTHYNNIMCAEKQNENRKRVLIKSQLLFRLDTPRRVPPSSSKTDVSILILKPLKLLLLPENLNGSVSDGSAGKIFFALWRQKYAFSRARTQRIRHFSNKELPFQNRPLSTDT